MAIVLVLIEIVGAHDSPCPTLLHSSLEGRQIDFMKSTIADDDIHLMTVFLVIVQGIVFHTGCDTLRLKSLNIRHHHSGSQPGILAHIFEVAAIQRGAVDVHARTQHDMLATIEGLFAQALTIELGETRIPGGSQTGKSRESHTGVVGLTSLLPLIPKHIGTYAMRSIVGPQIGEAQTFHTRT